MTTICRRLHRGDDLLLSIKAICRENHIAAGVILSGVGCLTRAVLRDGRRRYRPHRGGALRDLVPDGHGQ